MISVGNPISSKAVGALITPGRPGIVNRAAAVASQPPGSNDSSWRRAT